jgi:aminoglycoside/choline kinase family phosphotransferase
MAEFQDFLQPILETQDYSVTPLAGDASSRRYYRVVLDKKSWVVMEWEPFEKIQDFPFLSVQKYFKEKGVRVPTIHSYDKNKGLFLLEDLGDLTLERRFWEFQQQDAVLPFYRKTVDELIKIHSLSFEDISEKVCTAFHTEFSVDKLLWELNYAKKYLLEGLLGLELSNASSSELAQEFQDICEGLYKSPQVICHRDFHSRNVMLVLDDVAIIDFQDARLGPPAYDLVSLFHDSYVKLNDESIGELMCYYKQNFPHFYRLNLSEDQWEALFLLQTIQRCFKACGSFASFKVTRDDNRYLKYIAPTLNLILKRLPHWKQNSTLEKLLLDSQENWENL